MDKLRIFLAALLLLTLTATMAAAEEERVSMNFKDAEIEDVVKFISELTGGNYIIDVAPGHVQDLRGLESRLNLMTGVVECGLFLEIATTVVVARDSRIEVIER